MFNNKLPLRLLKECRDGKVVPFVGAGFSKQADPSIFPNWKELAKRLLSASVKEYYISESDAQEIETMLDGGQFLMAAEAIKVKIPKDFYSSFLESQFDPYDVKTSVAHRYLLELEPPLIITTNYDRLIEDAYASCSRRAMTVLKYTEAGSAQKKLQESKARQRPFLYKIHGNIDEIDSVIFSESDYRRLLYDELGYRTVLSAIFIHYTVLFVGFSLNDAEIDLHLAQLRYYLKGNSQPDYILLSDEEVGQVKASRLRNDYGLEVISYSPSGNHKELVDILSSLAKERKSIK